MPCDARVLDLMTRNCRARPTQKAGGANGNCGMNSELEGMKIELLDFSRIPMPEGQIQLSPRTLPAAGGSSSHGVLLRGAVHYGERQSVPFWARVRISMPRSVVVARRAIRGGATITSSDVEMKPVRENPFTRQESVSAEAVTGMIARRSLKAGERIYGSFLSAPPAVKRGDDVEVTAHWGGTFLRLQAKAVNPAAVGERVLLINPLNGSRFSAKVTDKGTAMLGEGIRTDDANR